MVSGMRSGDDSRRRARRQNDTHTKSRSVHRFTAGRPRRQLANVSARDVPFAGVTITAFGCEILEDRPRATFSASSLASSALRCVQLATKPWAVACYGRAQATARKHVMRFQNLSPPDNGSRGGGDIGRGHRLQKHPSYVSMTAIPFPIFRCHTHSSPVSAVATLFP